MSEALRESIVAARCFFRRLPLFFRAAPKTPLRVLGIVAFDTLHVLRTSGPLPTHRVTALATFLDFEGCANAEWDHKDLCPSECRAIRNRLVDAGLGDCIETYGQRLRQLEGTRPALGGDHRRFAEVRKYREAVARLSLSTAATIALHSPVDEDEDVDILCRILMQCQIVDDVLDYTEDSSAGLPSFLTACASLPDALTWSREAARSYATMPSRPGRSAVYPFRVALWLFTLVARGVIHISRSAHQTVKTHAAQQP
jgi:hypothetical protein